MQIKLECTVTDNHGMNSVFKKTRSLKGFTARIIHWGSKGRLTHVYQFVEWDLQLNEKSISSFTITFDIYLRTPPTLEKYHLEINVAC